MIFLGLHSRLFWRCMILYVCLFLGLLSKSKELKGREAAIQECLGSFRVYLLRLKTWTATMIFPFSGRTWHQICLQEYRSRVAYCIPILANASIAYDVSKRPTPEMVEQAQRYRFFNCCFRSEFLLCCWGGFAGN